MKMKKFIAILSVVSMMAVAATGCGSSSDATSSDAASTEGSSSEAASGDWDSASALTVVSRED